MSFKDAQLAIETKFATAFSGCPVKYENVDFQAGGEDTFCELIVVNTATRRASIGGPGLHREWGLIQARIFTPRNTGTVTGRDLADGAAGIFRDAQFSGITCLSPTVKNVGEVEGWWLTVMSVEFYRDETF
jgi:hypothetical protein